MSTKFTPIELAILEWFKANGVTRIVRSQTGNEIEEWNDLYEKIITDDIPCEFDKFMETIINLMKEEFLVSSPRVHPFFPTMVLAIDIDICAKGLSALREL